MVTAFNCDVLQPFPVKLPPLLRYLSKVSSRDQLTSFFCRRLIGARTKHDEHRQAAGASQTVAIILRHLPNRGTHHGQVSYCRCANAGWLRARDHPRGDAHVWRRQRQRASASTSRRNTASANANQIRAATTTSAVAGAAVQRAAGYATVAGASVQLERTPKEECELLSDREEARLCAQYPQRESILNSAVLRNESVHISAGVRLRLMR
jgi:hypothetical protein